MKSLLQTQAIILLFSLSQCSRAFILPSNTRRIVTKPHRNTINSLHAEKSKKGKGVYVRPSAAIEKGSGFFIPGLEGPRVRLLFGVTLLFLTVINHFLVGYTESSFTESLAAGYAILLLLQAAIEFGKEEKGFVVTLENNTPSSGAVSSSGDGGDGSSSNGLIQRWSNDDNISPDIRDRIQWSATTFLALTPATTILLLDSDGIRFSLSSTTIDISDEEVKDRCKAALKTISNSKSGRVSLPPTHPATKLVPIEENRCIVLQNIDNERCWLMSSTQLIQAFTDQDLKWLGQLGSYIQRSNS